MNTKFTLYSLQFTDSPRKVLSLAVDCQLSAVNRLAGGQN